MELHESAGSEAALDLVNAGKLDVALVQGGLRIHDRVNVRQVATLNLEPLHLLVKKESFEAVSANLAALDGKTVNLGSVGSGTHSLAQDVLTFAGMHARQPGGSTGYVATALGQTQLHGEKDRSKLPDAVFVVSTLPSDLSRFLVNERDYRLVPLPFGEAFSLDGLAVCEAGQLASSQASRVCKGQVRAVVIPAFTYRVEPPVPATALPVLGTRLLLVAHKDVNAQAAMHLVDAVYATEFATASRPALDVKLLDMPPEFPWHRGTRTYLERNTPIVSGMVMDSAHKGFAILAAAASGLFVLWQWLKQRSHFMRAHGFNKYINQVACIEETATRVDREEIGGVAIFRELRDELAAIKSEALARFTEGELIGNELMQGFLVQVHDVRDYIQSVMQRHEKMSDNGTPDKVPVAK